MADHSLDRQVGIDRLADDIKKLQQQVSELRTLQLQGNDAVNLTLSGTAATTISLPNGGTQGIVFSLSNADGKRLIGIPFVMLYEGSVGAGNEIMAATALGANYEWRTWMDWGLTDNNNLIFFVWFKNNSGSTQNVVFRGNWRYLISSATAS